MIRRGRSKRALIAGLVVLFTLGCTAWGKSQVRRKERILTQELHMMRMSIDQYTQDKNTPPQTLQDLVRAGYLREIPVDPFTNSSQTWQAVQDDVMESLNQIAPGTTDVHSGSDRVSSDGRRYSSW